MTNYEVNRGALTTFKSQGCAICGEEDDPRIIEAHHVDPSQKRFTLGSLGALNKNPFEYAAEMANCIPLCPNCHRKVEVGIIELPEENEE